MGTLFVYHARFVSAVSTLTGRFVAPVMKQISGDVFILQLIFSMCSLPKIPALNGV